MNRLSAPVAYILDFKQRRVWNNMHRNFWHRAYLLYVDGGSRYDARERVIDKMGVRDMMLESVSSMSYRICMMCHCLIQSAVTEASTVAEITRELLTVLQILQKINLGLHMTIQRFEGFSVQTRTLDVLVLR
jgi:hypothetical protein